jgi:hypothetical protein
VIADSTGPVLAGLCDALERLNACHIDESAPPALDLGRPNVQQSFVVNPLKLGGYGEHGEMLGFLVVRCVRRGWQDVSGKRCQPSDEKRFDDRRLAPAFFVKAQADFLDECPAPVMAGDLVERG